MTAPRRCGAHFLSPATAAHPVPELVHCALPHGHLPQGADGYLHVPITERHAAPAVGGVITWPDDASEPGTRQASHP